MDDEGRGGATKSSNRKGSAREERGSERITTHERTQGPDMASHALKAKSMPHPVKRVAWWNLGTLARQLSIRFS